jgi:hypothetical protein
MPIEGSTEYEKNTKILLLTSLATVQFCITLLSMLKHAKVLKFKVKTKIIR